MQNLSINLMHMLQECKKFCTIMQKLSPKDIYSQKYQKLPLLILYCLTEIYHIFTSIVNLYSGTEAQVWFIYKIFKQSYFQDYSGYIDYIKDRIKENEQECKFDEVAKKIGLYQIDTVFNQLYPYFQDYNDCIFILFKNEMEEVLGEMIKKYREKNSEITKTTPRVSQRYEQSHVDEVKFQICENILTGTLTSINEKKPQDLESKYLDDLTQSIHLAQHQIHYLSPCSAYSYFKQCEND
ncbi:hypothetical protein ABPG74_003581 [Tetrahymena malaccensis]